MIQKSTSLKYEPSLELLLITAKQLFLNQQLTIAGRGVKCFGENNPGQGGYGDMLALTCTLQLAAGRRDQLTDQLANFAPSALDGSRAPVQTSADRARVAPADVQGI